MTSDHGTRFPPMGVLESWKYARQNQQLGASRLGLAQFGVIVFPLLAACSLGPESGYNGLSSKSRPCANGNF